MQRLAGNLCVSRANFIYVAAGAGSFKKKLEEHELPVERTADGLQLNDPSTLKGLDQILALIHFYFGEEPDNFDRIAELWGKLQFALQFEDKMRIKTIPKG